MSIFDISGNAIKKSYDISGNNKSTLYDVRGNKIVLETILVDKPLLDSAMLYCDEYLKANPQSFAFPLITDTHLTFKGEEPKYIEQKCPSSWSRMLFLGDMINNYDTNALDNAVAFMNITSLNKIIATGNHELGNWAVGNPLPEEWYKPLLDETSVLWGGGDGLIYYSDDEENNVRYIVLDSCTPIYKSAGVQLFTKNELEWCASVIESTGNKDVIICNHTMGSSFYLVTDTAKENSIADTTITNSGTLWAIINAFINKGIYNVTDDEGITHSHDFSKCTGNFVGYFTGHSHQAGHTDAIGFNKFTCPMLRTTYSGYPQAISFFIIDKALQKIVWLVCDYSKETYDKYEYTYQ